jgi:hypothetical protein
VVGVGLGLVLVVPEAGGGEAEALGEDGVVVTVGVGVSVREGVGRRDRVGEPAVGCTGPTGPPPVVAVRVLGVVFVRRPGVTPGVGVLPGVVDVPGFSGRNALTVVPTTMTSTISTSASRGSDMPRLRRGTPPVPGITSGAVPGRW